MASAAVVILNWNGAEHLERFLPSVVAYTPSWVDIVVADNGSTDRSKLLIESNFPSVKWLSLGQNHGFARGYNLALAALDYEYYILLNSDVEVSAAWCEPLLSALEADHTLGAVAPKLRSYTQREMFEYAGASGGYIDFLGYPFARGRVLDHLEQDRGQYDDERELFWVSGAAFALRGELFAALGGFDGDFFAHQEEIDLCWRMQLEGYRIKVIPRSVVYHLGGGTLSTSSPQKIYLNHRNNLAMLYKCAAPLQRLVVALLRPPLDLLAAASYLIKGDWCGAVAVVRAWLSFIAWHRALSAKRRAIRSSVKREPQHIYYGSILLKYLFGGRCFSQVLSGTASGGRGAPR